MNLNSVTRVANMAALKARKNSPTILFGAGVVGSVATVVVACRATLKSQQVNHTHQQKIRRADELLDNRDYDEGAHREAVVRAWRHTSVEYIKLYGPAVALGVASIACLTKSHQILANRNSALTLAYAGLDKAFREYRARVIQEYGQEKDLFLANGTVEKEYVEYDKNGNPDVKRVDKPDPNSIGIYKRFFDESNPIWEKDHGYNRTTLENKQKWWNFKLKTRGYVFLNEILEDLKFEPVPEGQLVGWLYDTDRGDGYIDFGHIKYPDFMAGYERSVILDFNVDGVIYDLLDKDKRHG